MSVDRSSQRGLRILSLDGGDIRCISELHILQELMARAEHATGKTRPCDYFDLIVGVDAASPIAAFLGLLGMSVDEALDAFYKLYSTVFGDEKHSADVRAKRMETAIKELIKQNNSGITEDMKLSEPLFKPSACKVALCYAAAARMDHCRMFRNYHSPRDRSAEVTLVEALRAAWATPGLMTSIAVGPDGQEEELVSAVNGFCNPTQEAIKEAYSVFGADARISCILSLGSGQRGVISLDEKDRVPRKLGTQMVTDCDNLAEDIKKRIGRLRIYFRFSVDRGLEGWELFRKGFGAIKSHVDAYLSKDTVNGNLEDCLIACSSRGTITMERIHRSRAKGYGSAHGLPPLSAFFVMREKPMQRIVSGLLDNTTAQRVMVLSGLGGSGKTQLALAFANNYEDSFDHILFIDSSSTDTIETELMDRVNTICQIEVRTVKEALRVLARRDGAFARNWLIIFDNADDPQLELANYFPPCKRGSILITTRNIILENLAPNCHLALDVMAPEEAIQALLSAVFPSTTSSSSDMSLSLVVASAPSNRDRDIAAEIAELLGYFPIAIVQAGCYIRQQYCLYEYAARFKKSRQLLLAKASRFQLDKLKYPHSVYAAFNTTADDLSARALSMLAILSFGHFANFPRPLFAIAANIKFLYDRYDLLDRTSEFYDTIQFLTKFLCPDGEWEEDKLDSILEELQQYSLITLVPIHSLVVIRMHPMSHAWARDRLSDQEKFMYRAALVRLLVCGTNPQNDYLHEYLQPHAETLRQDLESFHVNDRAALSSMIQRNGKEEEYFKLWQNINKEVERVHGKMHVRTSRSMLQLADAYGFEHGEEMEAMEREVVFIRETLLGEDDVEVAKAKTNLAHTLRGIARYSLAEELYKDALRVMIRKLGIWHADTARAMVNMACIMQSMERRYEGEALLIGAVQVATKVLGRTSTLTIESLDSLAECYSTRDNKEEAEKLRKEILELKRQRHGDSDLRTVLAMGFLATTYFEQQRYKECEALRRLQLDLRRRIQGEHHSDTLDTMHSLARALVEQGRYGEAETLWGEEIRLRTKFYPEDYTSRWGGLYWCGRLGWLAGRYSDAEVSWRRLLAESKDLKDVILAKFWVARVCCDQKQYEEAEQLWKEELAGIESLYPDLRDADTSPLNTLSCLGDLCHTLRRLKEAEVYYRRELSGRRALLGDRHPTTVTAMKWLGEVLFEDRHYDQVEQYWKEAAIVSREIHGDEHPETVLLGRWLGDLYFVQRRNEEAEQCWKQLLPGCIAVNGENSDTTRHIKFSIGKACFRAKRWEEAERRFREVLVEYQAAHGEEHENTASVMQHLGDVLYCDMRSQEAMEIWAESLRIWRTLDGDHQTDLLQTQSWLGDAYYALGRYEDAEQCWIEELAARKIFNGEVSEPTLRVIHSLGEARFRLGDYKGAEELWRQQIAGLLELNEDENHSSILEVKHGIARTCMEQGRLNEAESIWKELLEARSAEERSIHTAKINLYFAELLFKTGRHVEAKQMVEEAIATLEKSKDLAAPVLLPQSTELLKSIEEVLNPSNQPEQESPIPEIETPDKDSDGELGDALLPDPGGDPMFTIQGQNNMRLPVIRPRSPFNMRTSFGPRPNSWSMF